MSTVYTNSQPSSNLATIPLSTTKRLTILFILQAKVRIKNAARGNYQPPVVEKDTFTERCEYAIKKISRWYFGLFGPDDVMDDVMQEVRLKLWKIYTTDQARMDSATNGLWVCIAKWGARNARKRLIHKGRSHKRMQPDGKYALEKFIINMTNPEYITGDHDTHDSKQVRQADTRMFVDALLKHIFETLQEPFRSKAKLLLQGLARGETISEIAREHGWGDATARDLLRRVRKLCGVETQKAPERKIHANKQALVTKAFELHAQGYSAPKIGAMLGKSAGWVQNLFKPHTYKIDPAKRAIALEMKSNGATWKEVGAYFGIGPDFARRLYK